MLLLACAPPLPADSPAPLTMIDARLDPADYADILGDDVVIQGPDVIVEPYSEVMYCYSGTWRGGDVGLRGYRSQQTGIGHHFMLGRLQLGEEELPDGHLESCSPAMDAPMPPFYPFLFPEEMKAGADDVPDLPEGVAEHLQDGDRWLAQAHYVNTGELPVRVQDLLALDVVPLEQVEQWASAWVMEATKFEIPPGESYSWSFDCRPSGNFHIRYMGPHMHANGTSARVEHIAPDGSRRTLHEWPAWEPSWAFEPHFVPIDLEVGPGDVLRPTCTWFNSGTEPLHFPHEMCINFAAIYPMEQTQLCGDGP